MSIVDTLKRKPTATASTIQAPTIKQHLDLAQAELDRLQAQHGDVALDALLSVDGADARLILLEKEIAAARASVGKLQSAYKAALARDEQAILQQRASLYKTQFNTVKRQLETRDQAAKELQAAFVIVADKFKIMVDAGQAARRACPVGTAWPEHGLPDTVDVQGVQLLIANEMYRQAGDPALGNKASFPGSVATPGHQGEPHKITPLMERTKAHTAYVLERLTGKAPGA